MTPRPPMNTALKAARQHAGYASQQAFASALTEAASRIGLGQMEVSVRQVRRWESAKPPWPRADHQRLLVHVLHLPIDQLGFTPPWQDQGVVPAQEASLRHLPDQAAALPLPQAAASVQPPTIGADFATITIAHRRMYWSVQPTQLHPTVVEHTRLGLQLLAETSGVARRLLATSLAESLLLAGRIEFFDLRLPDEAGNTFIRALQAAGEADDPLLGAAVLAHAAFIPGWEGRRSEAQERLRAARAYARRGPASADFLAWLDAVEAECDTLCQYPKDALHAIDRAERILANDTDHMSPEWFTWFSAVRLAAFKGNTQLKAGRYSQARKTLTVALAGLTSDEGKQKTVLLGDLAAVEVAEEKPQEACARIHEALDQLAVTWYATGMERIRAVRNSLQPWADTDYVRRVDDRLYSWQTTLTTLRN
jgi:tetratricopeptide (TPR) repeat protein